VNAGTFGYLERVKNPAPAGNKLEEMPIIIDTTNY
jgi:hypothetical protein